MSQLDFANMTDRDLKRYILSHPEDQAAFHLYMDRRNTRSEEMATIDPNAPGWETQFMTAIQRQIDRAKSQP